MRLVIILMSVTLLHASAASMAQSVTMNKVEAPFVEVINEIGTMTGYDIFYSLEDIREAKPVTINVQNTSLRESLDAIFRDQPFTYELSDENKAVVIKEIDPLKDQEPEKINIKGRVVDEKGNPLPSAYILANGSKVLTSTNLEGKFELKDVEANSVVQIRFVGYKVKEVSVSPDMGDIAMETEYNEFSEIVVVSTGYQKLSEERSTGSFSYIDQTQIESKPATTDILARIEGAAAGLNYTNGRITIRGESSLLLSNEPLIVVDGFPITGDIETVNPEDVESITILKDASAASIWGVQASNGVIVITTKQGKNKQKLKVDASAFVTITEKVRYDKMNWMGTSDQIDMLLEYDEKNWFNYPQLVSRHNALTPLQEAKVSVLGLAPNGDQWTNAQYDAYINSLRANDYAEDFKKHLLRNPVVENYNVSLTSASEKNSTYASIGYKGNKEASIGNRDQRIILTLNDIYKFNEVLSFSAAVTSTYTQETNNGLATSSPYSTPNYKQVVDEYGLPVQYYTSWNVWKSKEREALTGLSHGYNPIDQVNASDNTDEGLDLRTRFGVELKPIKELTFASSFQYESGTLRRENYQSMDEYYQRIRVANAYVDGNYQYPVGARFDTYNNDSYSWSFRNTLNFDKTFGMHQLTVFAGTEIRKIYDENVYDRIYGYDKQTTTSVPVNQRDFQGGSLFNWRGDRIYDSFWSTNNTDRRMFSVFSNLAYEFNNKYALNGSFRIDQANLFGSDPAFRYKPLWSAGLSWNISNEEFMSDLTWIDRLRLRGTVGVAGNSGQDSPYAEARNYVSSWGANLYDMLRFTKPENQSLKWEETRTVNIGADFALFKNRLSGSLEYYDKNSTDLLGNVSLDPTTGFTSARLNYASMTNKGVELTLNAVVASGSGFNWKVSANLTYNKNRVTDILDQLRSVSSVAAGGDLAVGLPLRNMYSYNYAGLNEYGVVQLATLDGGTKSWREDAKDKEELIYHGATVAPWFGGASTTLAYKGLDLTVNLAYKFGFVFRRNIDAGYYGTTYRMDEQWVNRWKKPGDELTTRIPKIAYNGTNPFSGEGETYYDSYDSDWYWTASQDFVYKADFVRVRDIVLGYNVSKGLLDKTFLENLRFTATVTNPYLWTANSENWDPEYAYSGAYYNLMSFTFGLRASF